MSTPETSRSRSWFARKSAVEPPPFLPPIRPWAFRLTASLVVPALVLVLVELGLRLFGWGYPTSFFTPARIQDRDVWVQNDQFGARFFSASMARSPSPLVMAGKKPPGTCRIFIFGESAALGDPEPAFGFGRYLQVLLEERFPGQRFEVVCTAMTGINSHVILPIARECGRHQGDIWVVYMGNNEFVGPFGASTVFGPQAPPLALIRLNIAFKATRLGQWLTHLASRGSHAAPWGGMKMFLENQIAPNDPRRQRVYDHFQRNLQDLLQAARSAGAKVVLATVAANLRECPPFASRHADLLGLDQVASWDLFFTQGKAAEANGDTAQALTNYLAAVQVDPG
ncbi:MAG TPA: hypothetical protein VEC99_02585, partial [Clostridia bacterium]|nr:hypothetical protein [Clostridia bacterium]